MLQRFRQFARPCSQDLVGVKSAFGSKQKAEQQQPCLIQIGAMIERTKLTWSKRFGWGDMVLEGAMRVHGFDWAREAKVAELEDMRRFIRRQRFGNKVKKYVPGVDVAVAQPLRVHKVERVENCFR